MISPPFNREVHGEMDSRSFFLATARFNFLRFDPEGRRRFAGELERFAHRVPEELCCQDVLEIWAEGFGAEGLFWGNLALFLFTFLLMAAADLVLRRTGGVGGAQAVNLLAGLCCADKFYGGRRRLGANLLILLYVVLAILGGFTWILTLLFLILFINLAVLAGKGGSVC